MTDEPVWADRWQLSRAADGQFDYQDYARAAVAAGRTANGLFGARLMWGTLDEVVTKLGAVHPDLDGVDADLLARAFGRPRFVHLYRQDTVAQAVSWARAEQTNYWHPADTAAPGREPRFDIEQIDDLVETINEHNASWRRWFAAHDVHPHSVRYEDVIADMVGVTRGILDFLGLELSDEQKIGPRDQRQGDELNDEWIARYRAHR